MRICLALFTCLILGISADAGGTVLVKDAIRYALGRSQLTQANGKPFHLRATIGEPKDPDSPLRGAIELDWVSATKWHREITSPGFSQTLIVNGQSIAEHDVGEYYPHWLSNYATALTEIVPTPMLNTLQKSESQIPRPSGAQGSTTCADFPMKVDRWVICFQGDSALFESIFSKGYFAEYRDYKRFHDKWVARTIRDYPEPGSESLLEVHITELTDLLNPPDQLFDVKQTTPPNQRIKSVRVDQDTFYKLAVGSTEISWPTVGEGLLKGVCDVFVSADREGKIREALDEGCDNAALQDPLHDAVMKWQIKPASVDGVPVQIEALLQIPFETTLDLSKSLPQLSDSEVRKLVTYKVDPLFPLGSGPEGTEITITISVDETGKLTGIGNPQNAPGIAFGAIDLVLPKWHFRPYIKDGKPQYFHGRLVFRVHYPPAKRAGKQKYV